MDSMMMMSRLTLLLVTTVAITEGYPGAILSYNAGTHLRQESGVPGQAVKGEYRWIGPGGREYVVRYEADEKGYRATGNIVPGNYEPLGEPKLTPEEENEIPDAGSNDTPTELSGSSSNQASQTPSPTASETGKSSQESTDSDESQPTGNADQGSSQLPDDGMRPIVFPSSGSTTVSTDTMENGMANNITDFSSSPDESTDEDTGSSSGDTGKEAPPEAIPTGYITKVPVNPLTHYLLPNLTPRPVSTSTAAPDITTTSTTTTTTTTPAPPTTTASAPSTVTATPPPTTTLAFDETDTTSKVVSDEYGQDFDTDNSVLDAAASLANNTEINTTTVDATDVTEEALYTTETSTVLQDTSEKDEETRVPSLPPILDTTRIYVVLPTTTEGPVYEDSTTKYPKFEYEEILTTILPEVETEEVDYVSAITNAETTTLSDVSTLSESDEQSTTEVPLNIDNKNIENVGPELSTVITESGDDEIVTTETSTVPADSELEGTTSKLFTVSIGAEDVDITTTGTPGASAENEIEDATTDPPLGPEDERMTTQLPTMASSHDEEYFTTSLSSVTTSVSEKEEGLTTVSPEVSLDGEENTTEGESVIPESSTVSDDASITEYPFDTEAEEAGLTESIEIENKTTDKPEPVTDEVVSTESSVYFEVTTEVSTTETSQDDSLPTGSSFVFIEDTTDFPEIPSDSVSSDKDSGRDVDVTESTPVLIGGADAEDNATDSSLYIDDEDEVTNTPPSYSKGNREEEDTIEISLHTEDDDDYFEPLTEMPVTLTEEGVEASITTTGSPTTEVSKENLTPPSATSNTMNDSNAVDNEGVLTEIPSVTTDGFVNEVDPTVIPSLSTLGNQEETGETTTHLPFDSAADGSMDSSSDNSEIFTTPLPSDELTTLIDDQVTEIPDVKVLSTVSPTEAPLETEAITEITVEDQTTPVSTFVSSTSQPQTEKAPVDSLEETPQDKNDTREMDEMTKDKPMESKPSPDESTVKSSNDLIINAILNSLFGSHRRPPHHPYFLANPPCYLPHSHHSSDHYHPIHYHRPPHYHVPPNHHHPFKPYFTVYPGTPPPGKKRPTKGIVHRIFH